MCWGSNLCQDTACQVSIWKFIAVRQSQRKANTLFNKETIWPNLKENPEPTFFDLTARVFKQAANASHGLSRCMCGILSPPVWNSGLEGKRVSQLLDLIKQISCWRTSLTLCKRLEVTWAVTELSRRKKKMHSEMCVKWISYPLRKILLRSMSVVGLGTIPTHFQYMRLFFIIKVNLSLIESLGVLTLSPAVTAAELWQHVALGIHSVPHLCINQLIWHITAEMSSKLIHILRIGH